MAGRYGIVGVIYIDTMSSPQQLSLRSGANKFNDDHLKLMIAIAHQAVLAVEDTQYYSAMVQAERLAAVGQTVAALSHDIKNILQGIRASFLIKDGLAGTRREYGSQRLGIRRAQPGEDFEPGDGHAHLQQGREPDLVPGDLNQVVADVADLVRAGANEKHVELLWQPADELPTLTFDPDGIHRAVLNIASNAIDACATAASDDDDESSEAKVRAPGRVVISTSFDVAETLARITVEDNGTGIPPEELKNIFSLFVSHKGSHGTGLGLPVSEKIVKEHGGRITVDSQVGVGSRFTLELPALLPEGPRPTAELQIPPPGK